MRFAPARPSPGTTWVACLYSSQRLHSASAWRNSASVLMGEGAPKSSSGAAGFGMRDLGPKRVRFEGRSVPQRVMGRRVQTVFYGELRLPERAALPRDIKKSLYLYCGARPALV